MVCDGSNTWSKEYVTRDVGRYYMTDFLFGILNETGNVIFVGGLTLTATVYLLIP